MENHDRAVGNYGNGSYDMEVGNYKDGNLDKEVEALENEDDYKLV